MTWRQKQRAQSKRVRKQRARELRRWEPFKPGEPIYHLYTEPVLEPKKTRWLGAPRPGDVW